MLRREKCKDTRRAGERRHRHEVFVLRRAVIIAEAAEDSHPATRACVRQVEVAPKPPRVRRVDCHASLGAAAGADAELVYAVRQRSGERDLEAGRGDVERRSRNARVALELEDVNGYARSEPVRDSR